MSTDDFRIRVAVEHDISVIMKIMNSAEQNGTPAEWYVTDEEETVRKNLNQNGFILVAEHENDGVVGFFMVKYPEADENLGKYLDYSDEQLAQVVLMDSTAVLPCARGNGLQGKMLQEAEKRVNCKKYHYAMCTVHPENRYSLGNMQRNGYEIKKTIRCYGGLRRHVLVKEL